MVHIHAFSAVRWDNDAKVFLSWIPGLNLYSQGMTESEAFDAADSALKLFVERCQEKGILEETLRKSGFRETAEEEFLSEASADTLKPFAFAKLTPLLSCAAC